MKKNGVSQFLWLLLANLSKLACAISCGLDVLSFWHVDLIILGWERLEVIPHPAEIGRSDEWKWKYYHKLNLSLWASRGGWEIVYCQSRTTAGAIPIPPEKSLFARQILFPGKPDPYPKLDAKFGDRPWTIFVNTWGFVFAKSSSDPKLHIRKYEDSLQDIFSATAVIVPIWVPAGVFALLSWLFFKKWRRGRQLQRRGFDVVIGGPPLLRARDDAT